MRLRGPRSHEMFSPSFLRGAAEGRYPHWCRVGDTVRHTDHRGVLFVWRLGEPDPRKLGWTLGVWPD